MAITIYNTGTASVSAGGTTVTGAGVIWTGGNAREGDEFVIGGVRALILEVVSATELTITPWQGENESGAAYTIYQTSSRRFDDVQIADDLQKQVAALNTDGFYHFVKSSEAAPDPSLGDEGQYAFQATTGKLWLKEGGVWVYVGIFKGINPRGPWDSATDYAANDLVSYGGSSYLAVAASTNDAPPSANWMLIAEKGEIGATGAPGADGTDGVDGAAATIAVGTVTTVPYGTPASVTNSGTSAAAVFDFEIPKGQDGAGTGDVVGPADATDGALAVFSGASGKVVKEIDDADGALDQLGATTVGKAVFTAVDQAAAREAIVADTLPGHLWGLTLSNNAADATNDIDIALGSCADSTGLVRMVLGSALTKRLDAAWAVGSGNGGLDTGSVADGTYHVFLIQRSDTGVVDALFSTFPTAPTMPASYDRKRRIGSILRRSGEILAFVQNGDEFTLKTGVFDVQSTNNGTARVLRTVTVPTGIRVYAAINGGAVGALNEDTRYSVFNTDANNPTGNNFTCGGLNLPASAQIWTRLKVLTNTSAQVCTKSQASSSTIFVILTTTGWIDTRGRLAE